MKREEATAEGKKTPGEKKRHLWWRAVLACAALGLAVFAVAESYVHEQSSGRHTAIVSDVPRGGTGVVLGCAPTIAGLPNVYFTNRIRAAAALWHAGKVSSLLVTGDNSTKDYNEAEAMKNALVERGVPQEAVCCDFAGLRTLDSIVRASKIFGARRIVIVSQRFHNERALAIASHFGIEAYGLDAPDARRRSHRLRSWVRERAARVAMMLDLFVLQRQPRFLGQREILPGQPGAQVSGTEAGFGGGL